MAYSIRTLPIANSDLIAIEQYLLQFYEGTAAKFFREYDRQISLLESMPNIGAPYKGYRRLVVQNFLVFYKVDEESETISVYRVIHGSRDIDRFL